MSPKAFPSPGVRPCLGTETAYVLLWGPASCFDALWGGPLMGGPKCHLSILRNGIVPCHYFKHFPVDFRITQWCLSILRNGNVPCRYFWNFPDDLKIVKCRLLNLGKGPVALSNLKVKGPSEDGQIGPPGVGPVAGGSQHVVLGLLWQAHRRVVRAQSQWSESL